MSRSRLFALVVGSLSLLATGVARAEQPTRAQIQYHPDVYPDSSARTNALLAGSGMLVGGYGIGVGTSFLWSDARNAQDLRLPVVGPVLAMTHIGCGSAEANCSTFLLVLRSAIAGVSGVSQIAGIGVLVEALLMPTRSDASGAAAANYWVPQAHTQGHEGSLPTPSGPQITFASPVVFGDGLGLSLGGRF